MTSPASQFEEFTAALRGRVADASIETADDSESVAPTAFREDVFTRVLLECLEDLGQVADAEVSYFERRIGRGLGKVNAWKVDVENGQATLVTTIFRGLGAAATVTKTELVQAAERARRVFVEAGRGYHERMEPASDAFAMMLRLNEVSGSVDRLRIIVLADGLAADPGQLELSEGNLEVQVDVWDLRRVYRADSSGLPYEPIEIDLVQRLGSALSCTTSPDTQADFDVYLAILPGDLLHELYHEYGPRLLELNVRSFLQARGKVNRGIRDTLKNEPSYFMAYNNGVSATAEWVETTQTDAGLALSKIRGLQIVNGGQTVASIHRAKDRDRVDLSSVFVQAKLTIVRPDQIETLVPRISRYANTQNRVNEADFSANHPFHVKLQQLSQTVWAPGEQSQWFYERARGQYQVAQQREGTTAARLRRFKQAHPPSQRFDKVKLAKYVNAWAQAPHIVSRGGQKNFVWFMQRLTAEHGGDWEPDAAYLKNVIAQAIIFKRAERVARQHKFPGYRANAIAYTVALVSYRTAGRIDLDDVWNDQAVSDALGDTLWEWMPEVFDALVESAESRNVTEWCKKEECWRHLQTLDLDISPELEEELAEGQPLPNVGAGRASGGESLTPQDRENIARVMQVPAARWVQVSGWGAQTGNLQDWQCGIATTLASYAAAGWRRIPSKKQARHGAAILQAAVHMPPSADG